MEPDPTIERIVEEGRDIRERVRELVERAAQRAGDGADGLVDLTRSTLEGASRAVEQATPDDPTSPLRQVVDGLADGAQRTAQAMQLAVEEAAGEGRSYSDDDLKRLGEDLAALSRMFADTVEEGARTGSSLAREQLASLREHAERTWRGVAPGLEQALGAVERAPGRLAKESAGTAAELGREAAGTLFKAVGELFRSAGERLAPPNDEEA